MATLIRVDCPDANCDGVAAVPKSMFKSYPPGDHKKEMECPVCSCPIHLTVVKFPKEPILGAHIEGVESHFKLVKEVEV